MKQNVYDNENFFDEYIKMRKCDINANNLIEIPIFKSMLPDINQKSIIDLGCGFGVMSDFYIKNGAKNVLGIDISQNMIDLAGKSFKNENLQFKVMSLEDLSQINQKFDIALSSLAFHYVEDFDKLILDIKNILFIGGELLFSNEHPVETCTILSKSNDFKKYIEVDNKRYYLLSDYNNNGKRFVDWNINGVVKYHRNFSTLINTLIKNGFVIEEIKESTADENAIKLVEKYKYQIDRPYFIFIKAKRIK